MEIKQHPELLQHIAARGWQMVVAKEGTGGFVTTDVPVTLRWSNNRNHGIYGPGFGVPDTTVLFPLSCDTCLVGRFEGEENKIEGDLFTVGRPTSGLLERSYLQLHASVPARDRQRVSSDTGQGIPERR
jgi:hypothetical protein